MNWMQDGRQQHHHQQQQQYHHQQQHQQQHHQQQQQHHQQQEAAFRMANQGAPAMRQHPSTHGNMPVPPTTYAPIGIRSGRGAARLPAPRRPEAASSVSTPASTSATASVSAAVTSRPTYPVSNRGKGRHNASRRVPSPQVSEAVANANVSGAVAQAFTETMVGAVANTNANANTPAVVVDKGINVKIQQVQPPSILKRKFSSVESSKPAVPVMEEKKDDDNIVGV
jgi:hypothetical protein